MKQIIFILFALFLILSSGQLRAQQMQGQDELPYKSRAEFQSDTLQYLEYNFTTRRYKGKKVSDVIKDIEYPVYAIVDYSKAYSIDNGSTLISISLGIRQRGKATSEIEDYYISIGFASPPNLNDDFRKAINQPTGPLKWTPQLYEFIKDLEVSGVSSNPYIIQIRENLKKENAEKMSNKNCK
jgi:hypothetical protein